MGITTGQPLDELADLRLVCALEQDGTLFLRYALRPWLNRPRSTASAWWCTRRATSTRPWTGCGAWARSTVSPSCRSRSRAGSDGGRAGDVGDCDLIVSIGGDGTMLAAIRAAVAVDLPVLGVSCGSLGVLTAVGGRRAARRPWTGSSATTGRRACCPRSPWPGPTGPTCSRSTTSASCATASARCASPAGSTGSCSAAWPATAASSARALGSSAYSLAAGGPLLAPGTDAYLLMPLARPRRLATGRSWSRPPPSWHLEISTGVGRRPPGDRRPGAGHRTPHDAAHHASARRGHARRLRGPGAAVHLAATPRHHRRQPADRRRRLPAHSTTSIHTPDRRNPNPQKLRIRVWRDWTMTPAQETPLFAQGGAQSIAHRQQLTGGYQGG